MKPASNTPPVLTVKCPMCGTQWELVHEDISFASYQEGKNRKDGVSGFYVTCSSGGLCYGSMLVARIMESVK